MGFSLFSYTEIMMLILLFTATILVSSSVVAAQQSHLLAQLKQAAKHNGQESTHTMAESIRNKVSAAEPGGRFLQLNSTNCSSSISISGINTTVCSEVKLGRQVEYVINDNDSICYLVSGIPCWSSYFCNQAQGGSQHAYIDCRNNPMLDQDCWSVDCDGNCLPDLAQRPTFANGQNGCKKIGLGCAYVWEWLEECTYLDVLGDGKFVAITYDGTSDTPVECWAKINGSSCVCNATCATFSGQVSYDCSSLSAGPCEITMCGECADRTQLNPTPPTAPVAPPPTTAAPVDAPVPPTQTPVAPTHAPITQAHVEFPIAPTTAPAAPPSQTPIAPTPSTMPLPVKPSEAPSPTPT